VSNVWLAIAAASFTAVVALLFTDRLRRRRDEAAAYLKGVRSVISGDPDAAIEALSDAARLGSPEAVETYLALGALFRREGDLTRAVRLHRNMLLGPDLPAGRRPEVERELAEDYRRSGMLAEAAEIYARLAPADRAAAEGLRDVRVEQGDLAAAVAIQRRLARATAPAGAPEEEPATRADPAVLPPPCDPILAHLLAAQAREIAARDAGAARALAREALAAGPESADAWLALAEVEAAAGGVDVALAAVGRALDAQPRATPLAWPALAATPDAGAAAAFTTARVARHPDDAALLVLHARALGRAGRRGEAFGVVRRALELDRSGEIVFLLREVLREEQDYQPDELAVRHDLLVAALLRRGRAPRCGRCGADAPARSWRCRRCGAWDAFA
jgi:lipopolysaccharide biosynthesis regulator YciM